MDIYWLEQAESDVPAENQWLSAQETICLSGLRFAKRRADWRLGRWTAKQAVATRLALATNLHALADIEIRAATSGAPEVFLKCQPADIAISLSHRDRTALCTVGPAATSFGCDLEAIEPRSEAFVADYFTDNEKALIARACVEERPLVVTLLWSGKESALKALQVGLRVDTRSMCVSLADGWPSTGEEGWRPLRVRYSEDRIFGGWWRSQDQLVRTVVSDPAMSTFLPTRAAKSCGCRATL